MEFFFEEDGDLNYARPEVLERTVILRNRTVLPDSTLVTTRTIYDDDKLEGYLEIFLESTPFYYSN